MAAQMSRDHSANEWAKMFDREADRIERGEGRSHDAGS